MIQSCFLMQICRIDPGYLLRKASAGKLTQRLFGWRARIGPSGRPSPVMNLPIFYS